MEKIRPLIWHEGMLSLLDQRVLPGQLNYLPCRTAADVEMAIRWMVVRGAPAIGVAAAFAMVLAAREFVSGEMQEGDSLNLYDHMTATAAVLKKARPTAVNLSWAVERMLKKAEEHKASTPGEALSELEKLACHIHDEDISINKRIGAHGAALIPPACNILTHCNAGALATAGYGTALGVIRSAFAAGKQIQVFAGETRPFLQGARLTSWELQQEGIPVNLIVDGAAGFYLSKGRIGRVIVGADRIAANGDVANKIGTYTLAVLAEKNRVPFYVAAPLSTFDFSLASGEEIEVEEREGAEITCLNGLELAPAGIKALNPSFDLTPASLVTAIITEYGVINHPDKAVIAAFFGEKGVKP